MAQMLPSIVQLLCAELTTAGDCTTAAHSYIRLFVWAFKKVKVPVLLHVLYKNRVTHLIC